MKPKRGRKYKNVDEQSGMENNVKSKRSIFRKVKAYFKKNAYLKYREGRTFKKMSKDFYMLS